jgi:hypothetical protein
MFSDKAPFYVLLKADVMDKFTRNSGMPVLGQLLSFIPRSSFNKSVSELQTDRYTKKFKSWDHLVVMLFTVIEDIGGIRELCSGLAAHNQSLKHLGMGCLPRRSTLSDANLRRSAELFERTFSSIYKFHHRFFSDSSIPRNEEWLSRLFLVDSTTITLFKNIMKGCGNSLANGKRKGGVKIHTGMWLEDKVPSLIAISKAAENDRKFMTRFKNLPPKTIIVFDKGYVNFSLFSHWTKNQVSFVSRLHKRCVVSRGNYNFLTKEDEQYGILEDYMAELGHACQKLKVKCRIIRFFDKQQQREIEFVTNDLRLSATTVAEIYKQRWQIELLFKRLKQNLKITSFIGDNENAIQIQIWTALIADLLVQIARRGVKRCKFAYSVVTGLFRLHLMNYVRVRDLLSRASDPDIYPRNLQLAPTLFDIPPPYITN